MTNQEAAEMIRNDMKLHHDSLSGKYRKALSMAISALQEQDLQPNLQQTCNLASNDCISRSAALDVIRNIRAIAGSYDSEMLLIDKAEAQTELMMLPPAQPERTEIIRCKDCNKASKCYGDVIMRSRGGGNIYCPLEFCSEAERRADGSD